MAQLTVKTVQAEAGTAARFLLVGFVGLILNNALLWVLTEHARVYYVASSLLATEITIITNFVINHSWTFGSLSGAGSYLGKLVKFNAVSIGGLLLSVVLLLALTEIGGLHYLVSNIVAIGFSSAVRYLGSRRWIWTTRPAAPDLVGAITPASSRL